MDRRRFLALLGAGVGSLAGCTSDPSSPDTESSTHRPTEQSPSPSDVPALDGTWASFRHDAANTGSTDDPGPTGDPVELWRHVTTTGRPVASPAAAAGTFVVRTDSDVLYARDADDGAIRWSRPAPGDASAGPVAVGETVVVAGGQTLSGFALDTGERRWSTSLDAGVRGLDAAGSRVVVATESALLAVDAADGEMAWREGTDDAVVTPPAVGDGTAAVGLASGVVAVDVETGERRWDASVGSEPTFAPGVGGGRVYVAAGKRVVAFDATTGDEAWNYETAWPIATPPVATSAGVYVDTIETKVGRPTPSETAETTETRTPTPADAMWFRATVVALDAGGDERWRVSEREGYNFTSGPPERLPLVVADGFLLAELGDALRAYDAASGERVWSADQGGVAPAVADGVVSTGTAGLSLADGSLAWRFRGGDSVSPPAVVGDTVYVGSDDTYVYALAGDTGRIRWSASAGEPVRETPAVGDDAVYVGTLDGSLLAFDRGDGEELWSARPGGQIRAPALADGKLYFGNFSRTVRAVDAADGSEVWQTAVDAENFVALEVAVGDDVVFAGSNGDLRAFDADDGSERWRAGVEGRPVVQSSPVFGDGRVYVNMGGSVRAFDAADGTEAWRTSVGQSNRPPVFDDGTVYAPGEGAVYALDAADGSERWRTADGESLKLAAGDDAIYALGYDTPLHALDADDGTELWRAPDVRARTEPAVVDEYLLVGDERGAVHFLGSE